MAVDLEPATRRLGALVDAVPDDMLDAPTPSDIPVGTLLDHVAVLATAFASAALKERTALTETPPVPDASNLDPNWRTDIPRRLDALADAWRDADAWTGTTVVGGIELPGEAAGVIALDEVLLHGWDLARATNQPYDADTEQLEALLGFLHHMAEPGMEDARIGLFGPVVPVPEDAPLLDRVVGLAGRDPAWSLP